ncbi:ATP-binding cassette domain-containing protein [Muriicola marianensis]|uniref:GTPase n=1 Tax=Muriicola marianensis TaxID=1324801 RepID=A0ABQ1QSA7_9FLAO|nr:ATP-binding cassette domain-containing protein [Muriicola marianensis]GGD43496.1 GTPase [Muriicola marianensis]
MIEVRIHKELRSKGGDFSLDLELEIPEGQLITLYGPSGSGKTSLLRSLAGLLTPDRGRIARKEQVWFDSQKRTNLSPQKRNVGFVFQENALFPNMTVLGNLKFAQQKGSSHDLSEELIRDLDLQDLRDRYPDSLSGGQKQRVSLARALAQRPDILLLDEPLAALDAEMRLKLQEYILSSHRKFGLTTLMVSHDLAEIIKLSDLTVVMEKGRIRKTGTPREIFMERRLSGKFQFTGTLLELERERVITVASVLIGNHIIKVAAHPSEMEGLLPGDQVVVASKAFNPVIYKVDEQQ